MLVWKNKAKELFSQNSVSYKKTERQYNEIRKAIREQNEKVNIKIEIIKKNETNLGAKYYNEEMKNAIGNINVRVD